MVKIFLDHREIKYKEWVIYNKGRGEISSVVEVGRKYFLVTYPTSKNVYILNCSQYELKESTNMSEKVEMKYFRDVAEERYSNTDGKKDKEIEKNVLNQFDKIVPCKESALNAYLSKEIIKYDEKRNLIFPFGINETQMDAVRKAFKTQISIIEGPPGTGKTQTILNIIANIIVNGKKCAIVSNNNSAVENVYEKLESIGLDFMVARLGRSDKKEIFFSTASYKKPESKNENTDIKETEIYLERIEKFLHSKNELAKKVNEIQEITIEKKYLNDWHVEHSEIDIHYIEKYNLDYVKTVDLYAYLKYIKERSLTLRDKWNLLIQYGIFRSKFLNNINDRESFIFSLQFTYYEKILQQAMEKKQELEKELEEIDFDSNLKKLKECSMEYLYDYVCKNLPDKKPEFTVHNYRKNFLEFLQYFPVIGSSSHSLMNSITNGYLLDYVIIDEASQQDLVPGILCLSCARNVVIVGDRKQLSHIAKETQIKAPNELYDCTKYSLLDSVSEIFGNDVPRTLLKEHYRCHPKIIQFCNKQFYDGELIPMTQDHGEDALSLVTTALGNHMRDNKNQREIESVIKAKEEWGFLQGNEGSDKQSIGFIAPYNNQVNLAKQMLPKKIAENTIHKFQGRECDEIIFSTVLDKKAISRRQLDFVDNAELVNVAVSRAKNKFTLVTGRDVFKANNKYIAALIRYIEYYGTEESIIDKPVISAFDLLYAEYDKFLEKLAAKLNPKDSLYKSEQIVAALLRDILKKEEFRAFVFHKQIYLKQLITSDNETLTEREKQYIKNRASCDFVIYYHIGKTPLAVIEVDGGQHDTDSRQIERDKLKNSILEKVGIPLLRLRTTEAAIEEKIVAFIREKMQGSIPEE